MKILHICYTDNIGGAAKAAYKMHNGLLKESIESYMLVYNKTTDNASIIEQCKFWERIFAYLGFLIQRLVISFFADRKGDDFSIMQFPNNLLVKRINKINPDIVHIHYLGPGIISIKALAKMKRKVVWTLHDAFIFTGGCHTPGSCRKYESKCYKCDYLKSTRNKDISSVLWQYNNKYIANNTNFNFIAPSSWMKERSESSAILKGRSVRCIHNPIDTEFFQPMPKEKSKIFLGLNPNVRLIVSGGSNFELDNNKGLSYFLKSLSYIDYTISEFQILLFGTKTIGIIEHNAIKVKYLGYLNNPSDLVSLYSAADVIVVPSEQESFGQVAAEAMACGTPVVAFKTSGLMDVIEHKVNGYLANPFEVSDLGAGIMYILNNDLTLAARKTVVNKFSEKNVIKQLIDYYQEIIDYVE